MGTVAIVIKRRGTDLHFYGLGLRYTLMFWRQSRIPRRGKSG
jgi:hypothetical protein